MSAEDNRAALEQAARDMAAAQGTPEHIAEAAMHNDAPVVPGVTTLANASPVFRQPR